VNFKTIKRSWGSPQDHDTGALITIDAVHAAVHTGDHFTAVYSATKNAAQSLDMCIITPDVDKEWHIIFTTSASDAGTLYLYKDSILADSGTAVTPANNNFNSATLPEATVGHTPTVTAVGTIVEQYNLGATSGPVRFGGTSSARNEYILKRNSKYLVRYTATNNNTVISHIMAWYEVEE
jgi:hypothetical protein